MKQRTLIHLILIVMTLAGLAGCSAGAANAPAEAPTLPPTVPPTAPLIPTLPPRPTATQAPPPTPSLPPTAAASPTLAATLPPTAAPPTAKPTFQPQPNGRFVGSFPGGEIVFRLNNTGNFVTLKEITLSGAQCGPKKINKHMTFESISYFEIKSDQFSFEVEQATVSGAFDSATSAHGTVSLEFSVNKLTCNLGPFAWTASAAGE